MNFLAELRNWFRAALCPLTEDPDGLLDMIRPAQEPRFGDYQANCAMPLAKQLGRSPREVAARIVQGLETDQWCEPPEIAGPGFINLRLRNDALVQALLQAWQDERLAISPVPQPKTYVLDYSSPNVAKPMHVGHIRSTVIGDALCRILRLLGHRVISDNHLGDWGTQFGMIIYGYKHFADLQAYQAHPVRELSRLYTLVNALVEYRTGLSELPQLEQAAAQREQELDQLQAAGGAEASKPDKQAAKALRRAEAQLRAARAEASQLREKLRRVEQSPELGPLSRQHADIDRAVLDQTAKLHAGDADNLRLWRQFLPCCREDIQQIYDRLNIRFDVEYGESCYQDQLAEVVDDLTRRSLARRSEGAVCLFLDGFETPMIIQKKDGAFLYATTDLATIHFRMEKWRPDSILYVVDRRQSEHFAKLFAAARLWGYQDVELKHISFGTVTDEEGRPFKTRSGSAVGLEGLLDEAVQKALEVVSANDDAKPDGPELTDQQRRHVARVVGHAAIKYADLSHNRTSDYVFDYDKMLALEGNTATYLQYCYARTQSIFARGQIDLAALRADPPPILLDHPLERSLALQLTRFAEALDDAVADYRPNQLTNYLFELAQRFSEFYQQCHVLRAESTAIRDSRLVLCELTGRAIRQGLELLGIQVVDKM